MAKRIIISDESVNCYGTWVKTDGVDISQYERNPVLLWMHWRGIIIGCIKDIKKEGDKITGEPYFEENEILSSIEVLNGYKLANQQLQQEKEEMQLSAITQTVKEATGKRLIMPEKEAHFIELGKKVGIESLKLTFDSMTPIQKPMNLINQPGGSGSMALDWKKLSDVPADQMENLKENDKPTYMKLFKAEYGVDCPNY